MTTEPIELDGTVRFGRSYYHAKCPNGAVIPCVVGWLGDMTGAELGHYRFGDVEENTDIARRIHGKFGLTTEQLHELQCLNDAGKSAELRQRLVALGIVKDTAFEIDLVETRAGGYVSLDYY